MAINRLKRFFIVAIEFYPERLEKSSTYYYPVKKSNNCNTKRKCIIKYLRMKKLISLLNMPWEYFFFTKIMSNYISQFQQTDEIICL